MSTANLLKADEGKPLLVIEVFLSNSRPHYLRAEGPETGVYVRLGSTSRQADRELIGELGRSVEGVSFDELPMPDLSLHDLDITGAQAAFGSKRTLHFFDAWIQCGRFFGTEKIDIFDHIDIDISLPQVVDKA